MVSGVRPSEGRDKPFIVSPVTWPFSAEPKLPAVPGGRTILLEVSGPHTVALQSALFQI